MPREAIDIDGAVERLAILDADGKADEDLLPELDDDTLVGFYRGMLRGRRFDERRLRLQRQGSIGTFAPVKGQEAAQVGAVAAVSEGDWFVPAFRETAAALWRGVAMTDLLLYDAGFNEGGHLPEGTRDLPITVPVASQLPHAAGIGYAVRLLGEDEVVLTFFGDGATSEGDFHEAVNFAGVFELPVIFLCQNNQWAISVPRERQTRSRTLAQKAIAYGIPGIAVDGNDVLAVHAATGEAVERARAGDGPTLIEAETYRLEVHTTADDPSRYRDEEEVEKWARRDPLPRLQTYLESRDLLGADDVEGLEQEIETEIDEAWEQAQARMGELDDPAAMFEHVYATLPEYARQQRDELTDRTGGKHSRDA